MTRWIYSCRWCGKLLPKPVETDIEKSAPIGAYVDRKFFCKDPASLVFWKSCFDEHDRFINHAGFVDGVFVSDLRELDKEAKSND